MDRAAASGATVIRTWFFQSFWDPDGDGSGDFSAFDRVLAAAAERGLRVVPVIANHWGDCEAGNQTKGLDFYAGGYREPFAGDALSYLDYAGELAARYAGSPAVAYWQLVAAARGLRAREPAMRPPPPRRWAALRQRRRRRSAPPTPIT